MGLVVFVFDVLNVIGVIEEGYELVRGVTFGCVGTLC